MLCQQCQEREAVVHLTQIAGGQVATHHLCERCAAEKGVESPASLTKTPVGNFLASLGKELSVPAALDANGAAEACPSCGATLEDFRASGRVGCATCYRVFEIPLRDLLRRLHGSSRHYGERYVSAGEAVAPADGPDLIKLREQLRLAIETENFELAAELRDRLKVTEPGG
jgi:protein arginine kinase activator